MAEQIKPLVDWRVRLDGHKEIVVQARDEAELAYCERMGIQVRDGVIQTVHRFSLGPVEG